MHVPSIGIPGFILCIYYIPCCIRPRDQAGGIGGEKALFLLLNQHYQKKWLHQILSVYYH